MRFSHQEPLFLPLQSLKQPFLQPRPIPERKHEQRCARRHNDRPAPHGHLNHAAAHQRRPVRSLLVSALCGAAGLAAVALLSPLTGFSLPLNTFTAGCSVILGLPGVILLLVLNVFL